MWKKLTILKYLASILLINLNLSMTFLSGEDLCIAPQPTVGKVSRPKKAFEGHSCQLNLCVLFCSKVAYSEGKEFADSIKYVAKYIIDKK